MKKFILLLTLIFLLVKPGWTTVADLGEYLDSTCVSVRGSVLVNWDTWDENGETDNPDSIRYWITYSNTTTKLDNTGSTNNGNQWTGQYSEIFRAQRPGCGNGNYTLHIIFYDGSYVGDHLFSWRVVPDSVTAVGRATKLLELDEDNTTIDLDGTTVGALTTTDKTGHILAANGLDSDTSFDMLQALVETNLDATISSRSDFDETSDAVVLDLDGLDADTSFDMLQALLETNLDATVSSRSDFDETSDAVVLDVDGLDDDTSWQAVQAKIDNALDDSLGTTKNLVQLLIDDSLGTSKNLTALLLDDSFGTTKNVINGAVATLIDDSLGSAKAAVNLLIDDSLGSAKSTITGAVATLIDDSLGNTKSLVQLLLDDSFGVVKQTVYILLDDSFGTSKNLVALLLDDSLGSAKATITGAVATLIDDSLGDAKLVINGVVADLIDDSLGDAKHIVHILLDDSFGTSKNLVALLIDDSLGDAKAVINSDLAAILDTLQNQDDWVSGLTTSDNIGINADDVDGDFTAVDFESNFITADKIASNAIGEPELAANAITSSELATSAVTEIAEEVNDSVFFADSTDYFTEAGGKMGSPQVLQGAASGLTYQGFYEYELDDSYDQSGDSIKAGHLLRHGHHILAGSLLVQDSLGWYVWANVDTATTIDTSDVGNWFLENVAPSAATDWTSSEKEQFRYAIGVDGVKDTLHDSSYVKLTKLKLDSLHFLGTDSALVKLGAAGTGDWTGNEKEQVRYALGIDGVKDTLHDSSYVKNIYYLSELLLDDSLGDAKLLIHALLDDSLGDAKRLIFLLLDDSLGDAKLAINLLIDDSLGDAKELMNKMTFIGGAAGSLSVDMSSMPSGSDTTAIREMLYSERWGLDTIWLAAIAGGDSTRRIDSVMYIIAGAGAGATAVELADTLEGRGYTPGIDAYACSVMVLDDDDNPVSGVEVYLQNTAGTATPYRNTTNVNGFAIFNADSLTFYRVVIDKPGYTPDNTYDTFSVLPAHRRDTVLATAFDPGTPTDPDMCRLYQCRINDPFGDAVANAKVTIWLNSEENICDSTGNTIVAKAPKKQNTRTDADGYWFADVYQNDLIYYNNNGVITDAQTTYTIIVEVSPQEKRIYIVDTESETSYLVY